MNLSLVLLPDSSYEIFHLRWCVEEEPVAVVENPHFCWKDQSEIYVHFTELLFYLVVLFLLFLDLR